MAFSGKEKFLDAARNGHEIYADVSGIRLPVVHVDLETEVAKVDVNGLEQAIYIPDHEIRIGYDSNAIIDIYI